MRLEVISQANTTASKRQKLTAYYNPDKGYTCINCDVDLVTLSITISVLQDLFDEASQALDVKMVQEIKDVTRRVVKNNEKYRDKSS